MSAKGSILDELLFQGVCPSVSGLCRNFLNYMLASLSVFFMLFLLRELFCPAQTSLTLCGNVLAVAPLIVSKRARLLCHNLPIGVTDQQR